MPVFMASADHHFDAESRWDECLRVHSWIVDQVERERPAAFLSAGDIYERASTPEERAAVARWLEQIAEVCPVVIAKGNHDRPRDCELLAKLRTRHPVIVEERAGVHVVGGVAVAAVAWPSRASLAAMVGRPAGGEDLDQIAQHELANVLRGLGGQLDEIDSPRVLLGHFMIDGSRVSTGQPPLVGAELRVPLLDLALARAQITIAGHIHHAQEWAVDGAPILYAGSPFRNTFGETEEKSIVLADVNEYGVSWSRIPTPATPMVLLEGEWVGTELLNPGDRIEDINDILFPHGPPDLDKLRGAEVRVRYHVEPENRDAAKARATDLRDRALAAGAVSVKLDEVVVSTTRARAPEIASARTTDEKLRAFWRAKSIDVSPEREARLFGKLAELEAP